MLRIIYCSVLPVKVWINVYFWPYFPFPLFCCIGRSPFVGPVVTNQRRYLVVSSYSAYYYGRLAVNILTRRIVLHKKDFCNMQDHHRYATLNKSLFNPFIPSSSFTFLSVGEFLFINFYFQTASTMRYSSKKVLFMIKHLTLSHCSEAGTKNEWG